MKIVNIIRDRYFSPLLCFAHWGSSFVGNEVNRSEKNMCSNSFTIDAMIKIHLNLMLRHRQLNHDYLAFLTVMFSHYGTKMLDSNTKEEIKIKHSFTCNKAQYKPKKLHWTVDDDSHEQLTNMETISSKMDGLSLYGNASLVTPPLSIEYSNLSWQLKSKLICLKQQTK